MLYSEFSSPFFDGYFAISIAQLVGLVILVGFAFAKCQGWNTPGSRKQTFFGFRYALILATFNTLTGVITLAVDAGASYIPSGFSILSLLGDAAQIASRVIMAYALIRVAYSPLRAAGVFHRDTAFAWAAVAVSLLSGLIVFILLAYSLGIYLSERLGGSSFTGSAYTTYINAALIMSIINSGIFALVGVFGLAAAIYSLRKSRYLEVHPELRRAAKLMIGAASVWTFCGVLFTIFAGLQVGPELQTGSARMSHVFTVGTELATSALSLILEIPLFALFVACFRKVKDTLPL